MKWNKKTTSKAPISYGFTFAKTPDDNRLYRGIICLLKGALVFCATFGTLGGLLSAFQINYNISLVFFTLLILCFALAFLHYNRIVFNLCYPVIFVFFTVSIFRNRVLANSGFQSFISILYEEYSSYFELTALREANIANTNQYLTISIALLFVGFVLALLLNIMISSYMSVLGTILLTAPILQIGIYIGKYPNSIYFVPLVFSYIAIGVLGRFKHHLIPQKKQEMTDFRIEKKNKRNYHIYRANGKVLLQTTLLFGIVSFLFLLIFYPIALKSIDQSKAINNVKKTTDEYVKIFVQNGLSGFFNRYESTGGMSDGRLGGVSSVRPDFETDLIVTFAPYSYETIYLKAFVGIDYTGNSWTSSRQTFTAISNFYDKENKTNSYIDFTTFVESNRLKQHFNSGEKYRLRGKMTIENVGANTGYLYLPYYTTKSSLDGLTSSNSETSAPVYTTTNHVVTGMSLTGSKYTYEFYPAISQIETLTYPLQDIYAESFSHTSDEISYLNTYQDYCYDTYTYVPANLIKPIKKIVNEIGYGSNTQEKVKLVEKYFIDHYSYSMSPGTTPYREDFIEYFLTSQNQGYCAHFASSATMILRYMGVPARYVEGYVIPSTSISNAESTGESYSDYMTGTSPIGETGVIRAEVTDASAHAWVEVYSDGFGWIPVEMTPPSSEDSDDITGFWDAFSTLFSVSPTVSQTNSSTINTPQAKKTWSDFIASTEHVGTPLLFLLALLLLFYPLRYITTKALHHIKIKQAYKKKQYDIVAVSYYHKLFHYLYKKDKNICAKYQQISPAQLDFPTPSGFETMDYILILEKALYSPNGLTKDEIDQFIIWTKQIIKFCKQKSK